MTKREIILKQAGVLVRPKNLGKMIASFVPVVGEAINQIEGDALESKVDSLAEDLEALRKLNDAESRVIPEQPGAGAWPIAVGEYLLRTVDFAVVYDGGYHSRELRGRELLQPLTQGCRINDGEIVASREAYEFALDVAKTKYGRLIVLVGMGWYSFEAEKIDDISGLLLCRLVKRDEEKWSGWQKTLQQFGLEQRWPTDLNPFRFSLSPFIGQEIGFVHSGEAKNVMRGLHEYTGRQFERSVISHFRKPSDDGLKTFVSGVLGTRVLHSGSPIFDHEGKLLGLISETESYPSDAGRRVVVRGLLGHPRFMTKDKLQS